jgi:predicted nucleic acid-binding protein
MLLIDTSVWIDHFQGKSSVARKKLIESLDTGSVGFCGPIVTELLRGCRDTSEKSKLAALIRTVGVLPYFESLWNLAGDMGFSLRRLGKTVGSIDLLIAAYAQHYQVSLLTKDHDFLIIRKAFNLNIEVLP